MKKLYLFFTWVMFLIISFPLIALAQNATPTPPPTVANVPVDLDACVSYFTQGDIWNWIGGGLVVVTAILGMFTKQSWLSILKAIGNSIRDRTNK